MIAISVLCFAILVCLGILTFTSRGKEQLYHAVRNHVRGHGESTITLGELMGFDWEQALYFNNTNPLTIYEAVGVDFTGTDLTIGILFIKNGEIVYYEYFPERVTDRIDLHPVRLSMQNTGQGVRILKRDDVLEVGTAEDSFGDHLFWMKPQQCIDQ